MLVTSTEKIDVYYHALVERKPDHVGIFYVGVKTTSVFCIATCRARKPKKENVEFFTAFKDALDHGYRPCKICRPTENAAEAPEQVKKALKLLHTQPKSKVRDCQLREQDISPEVVRRWFQRNYGMTFHAYQRMFRINGALEELKHGQTATATAYANGYDSLSGFGYTFKKIIGKSPTHSATKEVILIHRFTTPLGPMFACATEDGICLLEFVDRRMLETEFRDLQRLLKARIIAGQNPHTQQVESEISEYFAGKRKTFEVPLATPGTPFQQAVWSGLQQIPYGVTRTYSGQAEVLGKPKAVRAVASANGMNRVSIIVPCHRVIGRDGNLTGYGGGLERKRWLLNHERANV